MPKYKDYVNKMIRENQVLFDAFGDLHDQYQLDQNNLQERFNSEGKKVLEVIIEYENKLCRNTERGMYNSFSGKLAEKFRDEVRKVYPMIDRIGIIVETEPQANSFNIKKISLN